MISMASRPSKRPSARPSPRLNDCNAPVSYIFLRRAVDEIVEERLRALHPQLLRDINMDHSSSSGEKFRTPQRLRQFIVAHLLTISGGDCKKTFLNDEEACGRIDEAIEAYVACRKEEELQGKRNADKEMASCMVEDSADIAALTNYECDVHFQAIGLRMMTGTEEGRRLELPDNILTVCRELIADNVLLRWPRPMLKHWIIGILTAKPSDVAPFIPSSAMDAIISEYVNWWSMQGDEQRETDPSSLGITAQKMVTAKVGNGDGQGMDLRGFREYVAKILEAEFKDNPTKLTFDLEEGQSPPLEAVAHIEECNAGKSLQELLDASLVEGVKNDNVRIRINRGREVYIVSDLILYPPCLFSSSSKLSQVEEYIKHWMISTGGGKDIADKFRVLCGRLRSSSPSPTLQGAPTLFDSPTPSNEIFLNMWNDGDLE